MKLLGDWNWYLPSWLEWLPHVSPEGAGLPPVGEDDRAPGGAPVTGDRSEPATI